MDHPVCAPAMASPHIVIFPFPAQGHVNPMLKLAELLILSLPRDHTLKITFINTEHNHRCLLRCSNIASRFITHPNFSFKTISDGLPSESLRLEDDLLNIFQHLKLTASDLLADLMINADGYPRPTCIIADGFLSFLIDAAEKYRVPVVLFQTIGASCLWAYICIPRLIEAGELPIQGTEDMDRLINGIPGMESVIRCRDLPHYCRVTDLTDPLLQAVIDQTSKTNQGRGLILNTFEALEGPILDQIRAHCSNVYTLGPLHSHVKSRLSDSIGQFPAGHSSNSLWKEDRNCLPWLDRQPERSVVYVSFGSFTILKQEELMEFWHGLVNSKCRFLWVMRPGSVQRTDKIDPELQATTEERGYIIEWAPQEEVLAHPAIGGFLTHSGWNSTIESVAAGVPMICWPYFADQQLNSRLVSNVWGLGLDMKDICNRSAVETMINDLMVEKRDELWRTAVTQSNQGREAINKGGSSCDNMDRLIEDLLSMTGAREKASKHRTSH